MDANFKRMVEYGCRPEHARAVQLGVASHNLFDVAYALLLRAERGVEAWVEFEMLEGMANHQARAVQARAGGMLLYAPVVRAEDFHSAIAYLMRRLDENTAAENFLRHLFGLEPGSPAWHWSATASWPRFEPSEAVRATARAAPRTARAEAAAAVRRRLRSFGRPVRERARHGLGAGRQPRLDRRRPRAWRARAVGRAAADRRRAAAAAP